MRFFFTSLCVIFILVGCGQPVKIKQTEDDKIKELTLIVRQWLLNRQIEKDHWFVYLSPRKKIGFQKAQPSQNIVRQIGAWEGLIRSYELFPNKETLASIEDFRSTLGGFVKHKEEEGQTIAFVYFENQVKINASASYLQGLLMLKKQGFVLTEKETEDLPKLVRGIKLMARPDGAWWYWYFRDEKNNKVTLNGTGEAFYALARYYQEIEQSPELLNFLEKQFENYWKNYIQTEKAHQLAFFNWGMHFLVIWNQLDQEIPPKNDILNWIKINTHRDPVSKNNSNIKNMVYINEASTLEALFVGQPVFKKLHFNEKENHSIEVLQKYFLQRSLSLIQTEDPTDRLRYGGVCDTSDCEHFRIDYNVHLLDALLEKLK